MLLLVDFEQQINLAPLGSWLLQ